MRGKVPLQLAAETCVWVPHCPHLLELPDVQGSAGAHALQEASVPANTNLPRQEMAKYGCYLSQRRAVVWHAPAGV